MEETIINMRLPKYYSEEFQLIKEELTPDGYGGHDVIEKVVGSFNGALAENSYSLLDIGDKISSKKRYTLLYKNVSLEYGDLLKRVNDGERFVVIDAVNSTPSFSSLDFSKAEVIKYEN